MFGNVHSVVLQIALCSHTDCELHCVLTPIANCLVFTPIANCLVFTHRLQIALCTRQVWNTQGVEGVHRFLARAFRLVTDQPLTDEPPLDDQLRLLHLTIKRVTEETEDLRFNTAISAMMEFVNGANKWATRPRAALQPFVLLLAPYAPHLAEELWQVVQGSGTPPQSCAYEAWPTFDPALLQESMVQLPVQVLASSTSHVYIW